MSAPSTDSLKERILAMKSQNPAIRPSEIARALGCKARHVSNVLDEGYQAEYAGNSIASKGTVPTKAAGSGRNPAFGYTKLM